ncbi:thiamine phosphate synthase [Bartonella sp. HY038]|uniref:thiamine phosphate synthase n=1 Tax=Bartonella sp. HY038 TaxID=2759660 RepID=UPI0015FDB022|nr:thiamine phosphate synthase [Bartonella sp. HY038]
MRLDPFYPIFDSADWLERLVPLGIKLVQMRMKNQPDDVIRRHIQRSKVICQKHDCQLIINDYWQLAIEEQCDFVHLGQEDLSVANVDAIRSHGLKLGLSTHDEDELATALAQKPDYIALGPIYPTILKKMKWAPQGLEKLGKWRQIIGQLPLVAIGGLNVDRLNGVFAAGCDSAAVVTDITLNPSPETRVQEWLSHTAKWRA